MISTKKKTIEEYIEVIYVLQKKDGRAHTVRIASEMEIKPPSVTEILHKLQGEGYIIYQTHRGAVLTPSGEKIAKKLMKKHKVIADFLEIIGIKSELAEIDACQIEHHVSKETMNRLEKFVEFVNNAPHDPKWISHFEHYCKTSQRVKCELSKDL